MAMSQALIGNEVFQEPDVPEVKSKPDYEYKGVGKIYLAIHLPEQMLVVRGGADKRIKTDFNKAVPFSDVRGVKNFVDPGFLLKTQGLEIELNDLDVPFVRIVMSPKEQKTWGSRISQVCKLAPY